RVVESTLSSLEEFQERDSGWTLSCILNLMVNADKHNPLYMGCHIKLPLLNLAGIEFPMTLSQIKKFETLNDISINVYTNEKGIVPIRLVDRKKIKHVTLLCPHYFSSSTKLEIHSEDCVKLNDCAIRLSSEDDKWLSFDNHCRKEWVPFIVYADLECALKKTDENPESVTYTYYHHFSNLSDYDAHFVIKEIATAYEGCVDLLPIIKKKYICVFPYEYIDCIEKLEELCLLPRESFYSSLTSDLYLKTDVLSLEVRFELLTNIDIVMFIKRGIGCILEVDVEYPQHLRDAHTDICTRYGLHNTKVLRILQFAQSLWLCDYKNLYKLMNNAVFGKTMENFKTCLYEFHHEYMAPLFRKKCKIMYTDTDNLIHIRDYIELNTQFRTRAINDFEKNLYKLMNNAIFSKIMENVRNHVDIQSITKWNGPYGTKTMIAMPNFHNHSVFDLENHPPYSPAAPSDYHLFRSMAHSLADQHFRSYEEVKNWIDSRIASKDDQFFRPGIRTLPKNGRK
ncbi:MOS1T transposase, partial [Pseudoatta argentina]